MNLGPASFEGLHPKQSQEEGKPGYLPRGSTAQAPRLLNTTCNPGTWSWVTNVLINRISDPHPAGVSDIMQGGHLTFDVFFWLITSQSHLMYLPLFMENEAVAGYSSYRNKNSIAHCSKNFSGENYLLDEKNPLIYMWFFAHQRTSPPNEMHSRAYQHHSGGRPCV